MAGFLGGLTLACGNGDSRAVGIPDAASETSVPDATANHSDGGTEASAAAGAATFLAHFDTAHLPEGLWKLNGGAAPVVGYTALASLVTVSVDDGTTQSFGAVGDAGPAANSNTLGITTDVAGNVYVGVGSLTPDAGPVPPPGVYKFPPDGGMGTLFASAPGMTFANGLDFAGTRLYVADSTGTVYAVDPSGDASVWSADPLLAPDPSACDGGLSVAIGANGVAHDTTSLYVTNTNHGRIVKISVTADGGPGQVTTLVENCSLLVGADGLFYDVLNQDLYVAVNVQNKIVRVATGDGGATVLASGPPLDFPASLILDSPAPGLRRLLFTNAALFSGDAGKPGLLALPIP